MKSKREEESEIWNIMKKKPRTNTCRQVRRQISPILYSAPPRKENCSFDLESNLSSSHEVISCNSSHEVNIDLKLSKKRSRENDEDDVSFNDVPSRRFTRAYSKRIKSEVEEKSEVSCVESNSVADCESRLSKLKSKREIKKVNNEDSDSFVNSGLSSMYTNLYSREGDSASIAPTSDSCLSHKTSEIISATSKNNDVLLDQKLKNNSKIDVDLTCDEEFSHENIVAVSDYSSSQEALSELQPDAFCESLLDLGSSDYGSSIFFSSGSEFSEKSDEDSPPSRTYSLLSAFRQEFQLSNWCPDKKRSSTYIEADCFDRFEDIDDEESYQRLRERERKLFLHNYINVYCSTTSFGDLISEQRFLMVQWMIEYSTRKKFQEETSFLAVCLLDRFLSNGFFKTKRSLQLVGIACLTLAVRIVQNQPNNSITQRYFHVGSGVYSRNEVVAMEWLVQEVLSFQCFPPTIYNFMWFYIKAAQANTEVEKRARHLALLALSDHQQLGQWPSAVAAASVILAAFESNQTSCCPRVITIHSRTKEDDLRGCIELFRRAPSGYYGL